MSADVYSLATGKMRMFYYVDVDAYILMLTLILILTLTIILALFVTKTIDLNIHILSLPTHYSLTSIPNCNATRLSLRYNMLLFC